MPQSARQSAIATLILSTSPFAHRWGMTPMDSRFGSYRVDTGQHIMKKVAIWNPNFLDEEFHGPVTNGWADAGRGRLLLLISLEQRTRSPTHPRMWFGRLDRCHGTVLFLSRWGISRIRDILYFYPLLYRDHLIGLPGVEVFDIKISVLIKLVLSYIVQ